MSVLATGLLGDSRVMTVDTGSSHSRCRGNRERPMDHGNRRGRSRGFPDGLHRTLTNRSARGRAVEERSYFNTLSRMSLNWIVIGGPTWSCRAMIPDVAALLGWLSITSDIVAPLRSEERRVGNGW